MAFEVFGESADFDPDKNSIVRTNVKRLRLRLGAYYHGSGIHDDLVIDLSKGYVPRFSLKPRLESIPHVEVVELPGKSQLWVWVTMAAMLLGATSAWMIRPNSKTRDAAERHPRRLFADATSEGGSSRKILVGTRYGQLAITPNGRKLYALSWADDRSITVVGADDLQVKSNLRSSIPLRTASMSGDGRLYISSTESQVLVIDTATDRMKLIPVGAPVFDAIATASGRKLFLAMGVAGLKRLDLRTGEIRGLSPIAHPTRPMSGVAWSATSTRW